MARMANAECFVCFNIGPKNLTQERIVTQFSGFSMPFLLLSKGTVRQYFRRKRVRVCPNCVEEYDRRVWRRRKTIALVVCGAVALLALPIVTSLMLPH